VKSRKAYFDIGIAGPLAGFVIALIIIVIAFTTLPPLEYLFRVHPEYLPLKENYSEYVPPPGQTGVIFRFGPNLLYRFFEHVMPYDPVLYPSANEVLHYPLLMVGYMALFLTALNLLPIGQLDGGHIVYGLFGKRKHGIISRIVYLLFLFYAGLGFIKPGTFDFSFVGWSVAYIYFLYICLFHVKNERQTRLLIAVVIYTTQYLLIYAFPVIEGYPGWLLFAFIVGRIIGIDHPETEEDQPLDLKRKILGVLALIIFIVCISPKPFVYETLTGKDVAEQQNTQQVTKTQQYLQDSMDEETEIL
ncbi:MAG: site-2 protease family protein, partial [Bacteroidota bacterium]